MPAFRDGLVHVQGELCATCIFRPGNLMHLQPGRVAQMVRDSLAKDTAIICHKTVLEETEGAVCRGFYDRHCRDVAPLRLAAILGVTTFDGVRG